MSTEVPDPASRPLFRCDPTTGLPLLSEEKKIVRLILAYLPLPYAVAEYGCGKKTSLCIRRLMDVGVPAWAIGRGMIIERDLSPAALTQRDFQHRPHAMTAANPLRLEADLGQPQVSAILEREHADVCATRSEIITGHYRLQHVHTVQFVNARSHIFPILLMWNEHEERYCTRALDPTLRRDRLIELSHLRDLLHARQALILTAPQLGRFRLDPRYLSAEQRRDWVALGRSTPRPLAGDQDAFLNLLFRKMTGAEAGSLGDPATWNYANNVAVEQVSGPELGTFPSDPIHEAELDNHTGRGDALIEPLRHLLAARMRGDAEATQSLQEKLDALVVTLGIPQVSSEDAQWSAERLRPLAQVAGTLAYYDSLRRIAAEVQQYGDVRRYLEVPGRAELLRGLGVLLRRIMEDIRDGSDEAIARQMRRSGLRVHVDQAGNIHGVMQRGSDAEIDDTVEPWASEAEAHTVSLGGVVQSSAARGDLGVASAILVARVIFDLEHHFGLSWTSAEQGPVRLVVNALADTRNAEVPKQVLGKPVAQGASPSAFLSRHYYERAWDREKSPLARPVRLVDKLESLDLAQSGQVLQLDTWDERIEDSTFQAMPGRVIRGTLVQLASVWRALDSRRLESLNLHKIADSYIPEPIRPESVPVEPDVPERATEGVKYVATIVESEPKAP